MTRLAKKTQKRESKRDAPAGTSRLLVALAALAAVAALIWYSAHRDPASSSATPSRDVATAPVDESYPAPRPTITPASAVAPAEPPATPSGPAPHSDDLLTTYVKANIYPPTSRPLTAEQTHLIDWNQRYEKWRPTDADDDVTYLFTADKAWLVGDDVLTSTLAVRRYGEPISVRIINAFAGPVDLIKGEQQPPAASRVPLAFQKQGPLYVNAFQPGAATSVEATTTLVLYVEFAYDGSQSQLATLNVAYNPARTVPAEFTGQFREALENGSLVIYAGIEVFQPGYYLLDCNLFDRDAQPVAWTRFKGNLDQTSTEVPLRFFGKIFRDRNPTSPFRIGQLRGGRYVESHDPGLEMMRPFDGEYTTQEYSLDQFSDTEWDSAHKQHMIDVMSDPNVLDPALMPGPS